MRWEKPAYELGEWVPLECTRCGNEAECPRGGMGGAIILAGWGMGFIFDGVKPPEGWIPEEVQCRKCGSIFSNWGSPHTKDEVEHVG